MRSDMFYGEKFLFRLQDVTWVEYDNLLTDGYVSVGFTTAGVHYTDRVVGYGGQELIYALRPSALEGKRFKWRRHVWAFHNIVGHPMMQLLAWLSLHKAAMWVHDATTPKPIERRE